MTTQQIAMYRLENKRKSKTFLNTADLLTQDNELIRLDRIAAVTLSVYGHKLEQNGIVLPVAFCAGSSIPFLVQTVPYYDH
jgi:hypothetical protein